MAEEELCEWAVGYLNDHLNETAIIDYIEESCKNESFSERICEMLWDYLPEMYEFIFDGKVCTYLAEC